MTKSKIDWCDMVFNPIVIERIIDDDTQTGNCRN